MSSGEIAILNLPITETPDLTSALVVTDVAGLSKRVNIGDLGNVIGSGSVAIADLSSMLSLTGLAAGDTYQLDDTAHIYEYLGGGESDLDNWLEHSYIPDIVADTPIEPKYIINTVSGQLVGSVGSGAIGYRNNQGVVAAPSMSISSSGDNKLVSPKFLGACYNISTTPDLNLNSTFSAIECRHLSDVLDLRTKNELTTITITEFLPGATVLLPDSATDDVKTINMYDNTSTNVIRLRNIDYLTSGLLTFSGGSNYNCYISRTDLPSLNVTMLLSSTGNGSSYLRITDNPKLTSCMVQYVDHGVDDLSAVTIINNPILTSILLPGLQVDDGASSLTYYGVTASNNALETDAVYEMLDGMIAGNESGSYANVVNVSGNPCQIAGVLQDGFQYSAADVTALAITKGIALIHTS